MGLVIARTAQPAEANPKNRQDGIKKTPVIERRNNEANSNFYLGYI